MTSLAGLAGLASQAGLANQAGGRKEHGGEGRGACKGMDEPGWVGPEGLSSSSRQAGGGQAGRTGVGASGEGNSKAGWWCMERQEGLERVSSGQQQD